LEALLGMDFGAYGIHLEHQCLYYIVIRAPNYTASLPFCRRILPQLSG
jgi:hypothetical protein